MSQPLFLEVETLLLLHEQQISFFGGLSGIRDLGLLESAIAAPQHLYLYDEKADIFDAAACNTEHITGNHPFVDGNKRVALQAAIVFLDVNGLRPYFPSQELTYKIVMGLTNRAMEPSHFATHLFASSCMGWITPENLRPTALKAKALRESFGSCPPAEMETRLRASAVDYVTSRTRSLLIECCESHGVNPNRFDDILSVIEENLFDSVDQQLRAEFGMQQRTRKATASSDAIEFKKSGNVGIEPSRRAIIRRSASSYCRWKLDAG